jgi:hypothetical protein
MKTIKRQIRINYDITTNKNYQPEESDKSLDELAQSNDIFVKKNEKKPQGTISKNKSYDNLQIKKKYNN